MLFEKLVEQHRVHRVVAHCINFALLIANETLYQLSYTPEIFEEAPFKVQNLVCISTGGPTRFAPLMIFEKSISVHKSQG